MINAPVVLLLNVARDDLFRRMDAKLALG